jgi:tartrate dehydrogenase/decarboxylase/D-malate dehydrogenase
MLEHMGYLHASAAIVQAIEKVLAAGPDSAAFTPDIGGTGTTVEFGKAIASAI